MYHNGFVAQVAVVIIAAVLFVVVDIKLMICRRCCILRNQEGFRGWPRIQVCRKIQSDPSVRIHLNPNFELLLWKSYLCLLFEVSSI